MNPWTGVRRRRWLGQALCAGLLACWAAGGSAPARAAGNLVVVDRALLTVSLLESASGRVITRVRLDAAPGEVDVSPDGRWVVVSHYGRADRPGTALTVVDLSAEDPRPVRRVALDPFRRPHGVRWLPGGRRVLVIAEDNQALLVVDPFVAKDAVIRAVRIGQRLPRMVDCSPDGRHAYVTSSGGGTLTAVDLFDGRVIGAVATGAGAEGVTVSPDGGEVWVANRQQGTISVIDAGTLRVRATLPAGKAPVRIKLTPDGRWALVAIAGSGALAVFDTLLKREVVQIRLGVALARGGAWAWDPAAASPDQPMSLMVTPDGHRAWLGHAGHLSALDLDGHPTQWHLASDLHGGRQPSGLAFSYRQPAPSATASTATSPAVPSTAAAAPPSPRGTPQPEVNVVASPRYSSGR